jgi:hypothetical protein
MTYTTTGTTTFTIANARYLASKVAADMHLCARYYGQPSESDIRAFAEELAQCINEGYLAEYEFGFKKSERRVVSWRYNVDACGLLTTDDRPGKVVAYAEIAGASYYNFLTWNSRFGSLSPDAKTSFKARLPIKRTNGEPPSDGVGYWTSDRNYYSSGQGLGRQTFQPLS